MVLGEELGMGQRNDGTANIGVARALADDGLQRGVLTAPGAAVHLRLSAGPNFSAEQLVAW